MSNNGSRLVYIPSNLELAAILKQNPPTFPYRIDKFKYMISLLSERPAYNKDLLLQWNGFVPLNAQILQKHVHNYKLYLRYLEENGVIYGDNHYINAEKCKGYKFTSTYTQPLVFDSITQFSLIKSLSTPSKEHKKAKKEYAYLRKWFNSGLKMDQGSVNEYIDQVYYTIRKQNETKASFQMNRLKVLATDLRNGNYRFSIDDQGRCHTNITHMDCGLRSYLTYNGQRLVSLDLKSSQPFLSGMLMDQRFYMSADQLRDQEDDFLCLEKVLKVRKPLVSSFDESMVKKLSLYIMLVKNEESFGAEGFSEYISDVLSGRLYEHFIDELYNQTGWSVPDGKDMKTTFFQTFYSGNQFYWQFGAMPKRVFRSMYYHTDEVLRRFKSRDSTLLARLLQSIESHIMLDHVAKRISIEKPEIPLWTIHDSILCPISYQEYVSMVTNQEIKRLSGMAPRLKLEVLKPEAF